MEVRKPNEAKREGFIIVNRYDKRETCRKFLEDYFDLNNNKMEQKKFTNLLKVFAGIKGWKFIQKKSGVDKTFILSSMSDFQGEGRLI